MVINMINDGNQHQNTFNRLIMDPIVKFNVLLVVK